MNKRETMDLGKKLEKLDEYETLLENSNSPSEIYQLIEKTMILFLALIQRTKCLCNTRTTNRKMSPRL